MMRVIEILGICDGAKEDKAGLERFAQESQGTCPARCPACHLGRLYGLSESAAEFFPDAAWQRCVVGSLKKLPRSALSHGKSVHRPNVTLACLRAVGSVSGPW